MDDVIKLFGVFLAMGGAGAVIYGAFALIGIGVKRLERSAPDGAAIATELAELRERVAEGETLRDRVLELEERLDFAERLLAQRNEPARISGGDEAR
jgi:hypothetical protein